MHIPNILRIHWILTTDYPLFCKGDALTLRIVYHIEPDRVHHAVNDGTGGIWWCGTWLLRGHRNGIHPS